MDPATSLGAEHRTVHMTSVLKSSVLQAGATIDGVYRILGPLGCGGMGIVMLAHDEVLDRDVAIKLIRRDLVDEPDLRKRFLTEARAMARIQHPNVLQIYAFGEFDGSPYFVSELVRGTTVEGWLAARPPGVPPDLETALNILDETCQGVAALHAADTVHRDLKPSNLLLDAALHVRVADMGVSDILRRAAGGNANRGDIVGTPQYMAPEMVMQSEVDPDLVPRADVYSLGCLAFELLTGAPPFGGEGPFGGMVAHVVDEPPRVSDRRPELGTAFDEVVLHALVKDPALRTPSAETFRRALAAARHDTREPVRILLADDDADFRTLLTITLSHQFPGAQIECAEDGAAALASFDERRPSLAIIDLQMPNLDGMQLTGLLRARDNGDAVPIIVISGAGGSAEWKRLSAMGADGFLLKPVNVKDVVTLARRALADRTSKAPPSMSGPAARDVALAETVAARTSTAPR